MKIENKVEIQFSKNDIEIALMEYAKNHHGINPTKCSLRVIESLQGYGMNEHPVQTIHAIVTDITEEN